MTSGTEGGRAHGPSAADRALEVLAGKVDGKLTRDAVLGPLTTYQLGGPAAILLEAKTTKDLCRLAEALDISGLPLLVVGHGSNLLISDRGFEGIALRLGRPFRWARREGAILSAGAAYPLPALATLALKHSLTGLEFSVAIPGSFGGAIIMNAGAHQRSMADILRDVTVFDLGRREEGTLQASEIRYSYRASHLPPGSIVTSGTLRLAEGDRSAISRSMKEAWQWRRTNQPIGLPNAGSVFKNPPGDAAGRLIERICGKGMRVGEASVSEVHANFIVAEPGARAADVHGLIRAIQKKVSSEAGIHLETEVRLVGDFVEEADAED